MTNSRSETTRSPLVQIFLVSFAMLFAEIALIRWLSTEARIFAYVNNLVLLSCFLGIGLGCYFSARRVYLAMCGLSLSVLILMIRLPLEITVQNRQLHIFKDGPVLLSAFTDSVVWYEPGSGTTAFMTMLGFLSTLVIFITVLVAFIPLGQMLGRLLDEHRKTVVAYSINIAASIVGLWGFGVMSLIYAPPWAWFALVIVLLLLVMAFQTARTGLSLVSLAALAVAVVAMALLPSGREGRISTTWSPYQKLELYPMVARNFGIERGYHLDVNNVGYMMMLNLSDEFVRVYPGAFNLEDRQLSQYDIPYQFKPGARDVMILGAGAGNDVAGALRNNVQSVDAVEIDPGIFRLGTQYHPEKPYSDPRVNMIIDDARSYLKRTSKKYDVISFGLLDAHTLSSSYNNMRVDHYVYTLESFQEARECLREDGVMTVSFEAQRPWIKRRIYDLLREAFGSHPIMFTHRLGQGRYGWGGTMFVIANDMSIVEDAMRSDPNLHQFVTARRGSYAADDPDNPPVKLTVDDWPYLYLETPGIPNMHLSVMLLLGVLFALTARTLVARRHHLDFRFFFLGAAFLLLEFQNISKSTLLFGSTWMVNSFIITGILSLALLANLYVSVFKVNSLKPIYALLILTSLAVYFVPLSLFNELGYWSKAVVAMVLLNLPVFFGGIVFIESFKRTRAKDAAFGSNLLGAAVGGLLESLSFVIGINTLLLVVVVLYAASYFRGPKAGSTS